MRWRDPEAGMQYPSDFIPVLENAGMLWKADLAIFERVCSFQERPSLRASILFRSPSTSRASTYSMMTTRSRSRQSGRGTESR